MVEARGLTLLGVSVGNLQNADAVQLTLPFERADMMQLETAVDAVRDRFGGGALTSAGSIGTDAGFTVPMLPD
jgi:DNA polymerase-4